MVPPKNEIWRDERDGMESVLNNIEQLQRMADELATSNGPLALDRYALDCDLFLERIEAFVEDHNFENTDYLTGKLMEVRSQFRYLLRGDRETVDVGRYQALVHNGLNSMYRNMRNPVVGEAEDMGE
jgi:hypothetical protein